MSEIGYFGTYAHFSCPDREEAPRLMGPDNLVGDAFSVEMDYSSGKRMAWLVNPFGFRVGVISESLAQQIDVFEAKGWKVVALLACVVFDSDPKPGTYWGQVALMAYDATQGAASEAFEVFVQGIGAQLAKGVRPAIDLGKSGIAKVVAEGGRWVPAGREALPQLKEGSYFIKKERTGTDNLVAQSRKHFLAYTIIGWVLILLILAVIFRVFIWGMI